jgi:hypothetical protein
MSSTSQFPIVLGNTVARRRDDRACDIPPAMRALTTCTLLILATACGSSPPPASATTAPAAQTPAGPETPAESDSPAAPVPAESEPEAAATLPTPYTGEQIRDATAPGRRYRFRTVAGDHTSIVTMEFVEVTPEAAVVESSVFDGDGNRVAPAQTARSTWEELRLHATFPAAVTTTEDATVTVPAGTFETTLYTVRAGDQVERFWFARELPGPPVKMEQQTAAGDLVFTMELLEHAPGQP